MNARAFVVATLVAFVIAGCTSTVVLGTVPSDGGGELFDIAQFRDMFDGGFVDLGTDGSGVDIAFASDAAPAVDLAQ